MATATTTFRCMMCGREFDDAGSLREDKERSCPECRSNSVRPMKRPKPKPTAAKG